MLALDNASNYGANGLGLRLVVH